MKTAEEWWNEFRVRDTQVAIVTQPDIRKIQADALRHAARIYWDNNSFTAQGQVQELINKLESK